MTDEKKPEPSKDQPKTQTQEKPEPKTEPKKEVKQEKQTEAKLSSKLEKIAGEIENLTALELSQLSTYLEDKFGVSAMAMAAAPAGTQPGQADTQPAEEKSSFNVSLKEIGSNKLAVIKAVRELKPDLGLMDAKKLVESAPKEILTNVKKEEADAAMKKITDAGGTGEIK